MVASSFHKTKFVLYRRVSSSAQGDSGLGLLGQKQEINGFLASQSGYEVIADLVEVASGKNHLKRPVLLEAMEMAESSGGVLLVSRLDRLSRDLEFIAALMKNSKVQFRIATQPHADNFTLAIYAALATRERELISVRTKAALAAAKQRGIKLGTSGSRNIKKANEARTQMANRFASRIKPLVEPLRTSGKTFQEIADILNKMGMRTPNDKEFYSTSVRNYTLRF